MSLDGTQIVTADGAQSAENYRAGDSVKITVGDDSYTLALDVGHAH